MEKQRSKSVIDRLKSLTRYAGILVVLLLAFLVGYLFRPAVPAQAGDGHAEHASAEPAKPQIWTCSMHPQIKLPNPGLCPICNMDLIPLEEDDSDASSRTLTVSENARRLMDIETAPVERKSVTATVRMTGKIDYDETRLATISAWVPGRLERLFVDYTGVTVNQGDHLVELYSPDLYSAQEELLQARKAVSGTQGSNSSLIRDITQSTVEAARDKLRLWGLTKEQIDEIEQSGKARDHVTIYAPIGGIVIHKNALEGQYVDTGTKIYTIADLAQVWVYLDAYESDLRWLGYGQEVEFTTVAYPGETFRGTIVFIDPVLNDKTRTVRVRVNAPNPDGRLKPQMFVRAAVHAPIAEGGRVLRADLSGKWICPMHPDVIKDQAGDCDICGMPLVDAESLYPAGDPDDAEEPLVIPASAALITGTRAVVYVEVPDAEKPTYEGREIVLGPRAGDYYLVKEGLRAGERVVVKGNFKIDSSLQIQARPSMMQPEETPGGTQQAAEPQPLESVNPAFRGQLSAVLQAYYGIQQALANDQFQPARQAFTQTQTALESVDESLLPGEQLDLWTQLASPMQAALAQGANVNDIEALRTAFHPLSQSLIKAVQTFGHLGSSPAYITYCPMAFNDAGAHWLQSHEDILNPYFGASMLTCGVVEKSIPAASNTEGQ